MRQIRYNNITESGTQTNFTGKIQAPTIKMTTGAGASKVLTSDADGNATWEDAGAGPITTAKVSVSSVEMLAIATTAKELIAAPGSGKVIDILSCVVRLNFLAEGTAYSGFAVKIMNAAETVELFDITDFGALVATTTGKIFMKADDTPQFRALANEAVVLTSEFDPTGGDGTFDIYLTYRVITL